MQRYVNCLMGLMFVITIIPLLPVSASNEGNTVRDGNWWVEQSEAPKLYYVVGFYDGMELGHEFSYWGLPKGSATVSEVVTSYDNYGVKYLSGVTNAQLIQGLDVFYEDYRNRG